MKERVAMSKLVEKMELKNLTPEVGLDERYVEVPDINRPAIQFAGLFEHFAAARVQIIGNVEYTYLQKLDKEVREQRYDDFLSYPIPCMIFCRNLQPDETLLEKATKANVPVFLTEKNTSEFSASVIMWLSVELAQCISIHGVLVDVYGIGVLILGESGIGKSEAALERCT